jgi:hypothetical protein
MDKKTEGAWLVHHTNKLGRVDDNGNFDRLKLAGKSAILLSAMARDRQTSIDTDRLKALAIASRVNPTFELPHVLATLRSNHLIEQGTNGVDVLGLTTSAILQQSSDVFRSLNPTTEEVGSLHLAEVCSGEPRQREDIALELSDEFKLSTTRTRELLDAAEEIGFTDFEDIDNTQRVYFNGNLFRRNTISKVQAVLASVTPTERALITEAENVLRAQGCVDVELIEKMLGRNLFRKLSAIGMFDLNIVKSSRDSAGFVTRPSAFTKFGEGAATDAFDLAKAFVACLSYGIHRSTPGRGKITMIARLLRKLINGASVGPATAIGEDYKILEMRGVIQVRREGTMFHMTLLKKDIGELALKVLTEGDASDESLLNFPGAAVTEYIPPEERRALIRKDQRKLPDRQINELLQNLRSGKVG